MQETDTSRYAHIRFPGAGLGEKNGTVTNSERRISRQRPFWLPRAGKTGLVDCCPVAKQLAMVRPLPGNIRRRFFCEHAALSAFENDGARAFNLHALAGLTREAWDQLEPYQWAAGDFPTGIWCPLSHVRTARCQMRYIRCC